MVLLSGSEAKCAETQHLEHKHDSSYKHLKNNCLCQVMHCDFKDMLCVSWDQLRLSKDNNAGPEDKHVCRTTAIHYVRTSIVS